MTFIQNLFIRNDARFYKFPSFRIFTGTFRTASLIGREVLFICNSKCDWLFLECNAANRKLRSVEMENLTVWKIPPVFSRYSRTNELKRYFEIYFCL